MATQKTQLATFAAGCFWHVEEAFMHLKGVIKTTVGYTGGNAENPSYKDVCSGKTGHAESVQVEFNPKQISYENLLKVFWSIHDPTQVNKQGPDIGAQYRSAIFYHNENQKQAAISLKNKLQKSGIYKNKKIATEIAKAPEFYPAEDYHQKYFEKHKIKKMLMCGM